jgi:hypothetical protein
MSDRALNVYEVLRQEYERLHDDAPPAGVDWDKIAEKDDESKDPKRPLEAAKVRELLPALFEKIHAKERTALCFSGGGIRSATFSLGVMQRLARLKLLQQFDYLSTVSGGGYIGSWLSSFVRRTESGIDGVAQQLSAKPATTLDPEPQQIRHLREYSNYLTPKLGLFSGDTWSLAGNYLRNLLLNLLILIPLLAAVLAVPRVVVAVLRHEAELLDELKIVTLALFAFAVFALAFLRPVRGGLPNRKPYNNGGFLLLVVLPFFLAAIGIVLYVGWTFGQPRNWLLAFGALALTSALSSVIYTIRFWLASPKENRGEVTGGASVTAYTFKKLGWETIAAVISAATATGLLWASEKYLFNNISDRVELPTIKSWESLPAVLSSAHAAVYVCFAVPLVLAILFVQSAIFVGLSSRLNEDYDREWWARAGGWVLVTAVAWIAFTGIGIYGPVLIYLAPRIFAALGAGTGAFTILSGKSGKTSSGEQQKEDESKTSVATNIALGLAAPIFAVCILALISLVTSRIVLAQSAAKFVTDDEIALYSSATYQQKGTVKIGDDRERVFETAKYPAIEKDRLRAIEHLYAIDNAEVGTVGKIFLATVFAWFISLFIGVNKFSMHAFYRNRLIRAYLGASRHNRDPNPFTGFDPNDNIQMHKLRGESFWVHSFRNLDKFVADLQKPPATKAQPMLGFLFSQLTPRTRDLLAKYHPDPAKRRLVSELLFEDLNRIVDDYDLVSLPPQKKPYDPTRSNANRRHLDDVLRDYLNPASNGRPFHIVNMALNLVSGDNLAWQQRKARSFTVSPLHSGNYQLGYRASRDYGGPDGISLGTSVAISGAAASPNMGYHSSPALSFLLTLFNVRLGWWLGNPGPAGNKTYKLRNPLTSLKPLIAEIFGMTDDQHPYIYLSDGGHFENLALYEMVLRRCHSIVVIDAGADADYVFEDLGNAVRKIRIDLGIPITVDAKGLYPRRNVKENPKYCAVGTIDYAAVDGGTAKGHFLYIKPAFYEKDEPRDVYNYAKTSESFPHESTGDQWFSESQFESYRALGDFALESIIGQNKPATVAALITRATDYIAPPKPAAGGKPG